VYEATGLKRMTFKRFTQKMKVVSSFTVLTLISFQNCMTYFPFNVEHKRRCLA